jgi:hypothetical protein
VACLKYEMKWGLLYTTLRYALHDVSPSSDMMDRQHCTQEAHNQVVVLEFQGQHREGMHNRQHSE